MQLDRFWLRHFRKPQRPPQKNEPFSQDVHSRIPFVNWGWNLPIPKPGCRALGLHVLENEYHQSLPDIDLILIRAVFFFSLWYHNLSLFHCWKAERGWWLSINLQTPENDHCRIYSLWSLAGIFHFLSLHFFPLQMSSLVFTVFFALIVCPERPGWLWLRMLFKPGLLLLILGRGRRPTTAPAS